MWEAPMSRKPRTAFEAYRAVYKNAAVTGKDFYLDVDTSG
jgi:hypothetical protein